MAKPKRKAAKSKDEEFNPSTAKQSKKKNSDDQNEETELTSIEFKCRVREAVSKIDHETLVNLLAMNVKMPKKNTQHNGVMFKSECAKLFNLLWSRSTTADPYMARRDAVLLCMSALLGDPRTSNANGDDIIVRLCLDRRDMGDVLALAIRRWDITRATLYEFVWTECYRARAERHRVFETLINHPDFNFNVYDAKLGRSLIASVTTYINEERYNPHLLPTILAHPLVQPDLLDRGMTALSRVDYFYCLRYTFDKLRSVKMKQRSVRDARLLLQHDRVDIHKMTELSVDEGYDGLVE